MDKQYVLVRTNPDCLVLDVEFAQRTGKRKYIGRKEVLAWKLEDLPDGCPKHVAHNEFLTPEDKRIPHAAYPLLTVPEKIELTSHYARAIARGELVIVE